MCIEKQFGFEYANPIEPTVSYGGTYSVKSLHIPFQKLNYDWCLPAQVSWLLASTLPITEQCAGPIIKMLTISEELTNHG